MSDHELPAGPPRRTDDAADAGFGAATRYDAPPGGTPDTAPGTPALVLAWGELVAFGSWLEATYGVALLLARQDAEEKAGRALADWHVLFAGASSRVRDALGTHTHHEPPAHRQLRDVMLADGIGPDEMVEIRIAAS
jgi:hypothetical protein